MLEYESCLGGCVITEYESDFSNKSWFIWNEDTSQTFFLSCPPISDLLVMHDELHDELHDTRIWAPLPIIIDLANRQPFCLTKDTAYHTETYNVKPINQLICSMAMMPKKKMLIKNSMRWNFFFSRSKRTIVPGLYSQTRHWFISKPYLFNGPFGSTKEKIPSHGIFN